MIDAAGLFRLLADETRLRILVMLSRGELCVCDIMSILGATQSKTSRHLAYLRSAGLVRDRRDGQWIYYSLAAPSGRLQRRVFDWLQHAADDLPQAADDLRALAEIKKSGKSCARATFSADDADNVGYVARKG